MTGRTHSTAYRWSDTAADPLAAWIMASASVPGASLPDTSMSDVIRLNSPDWSEVPLVFVGTGTCGLGAGAAKTLQKSREILHSIGGRVIEVGCIGLCSMEPLMDVQLPGKRRISFSRVLADDVPEIIEAVIAGNPPADRVLGQYADGEGEPWPEIPFLEDHPFFKNQKRIVLKNCGVVDPGSIEAYVSTGGYHTLAKTLTTRTPDEVRTLVEQSGLRGRGGGGFPTGKKWAMAASEMADQRYLICNADEGDPGAFMDRAVIEGDPHRLVEGMAIAAYAIGATKAYVYIRAEYPLAIKRLGEAIDQAQRHGLLGFNILGSGVDLEIKMKMGAGAFVCGEETALIASIEGRRGMPRPRPPYPTTKGLFGRPTVINNVETLANLPWLVQHGADAFAAIGTRGSRGTKVFALSGKVMRTGLVEVPMGTSIRDIVFNMGGGIPGNKVFKAVQIGGPSGGCIPESHLGTEIDYESLKDVGAMMGSGGLVVMDEDTCMVDLARFFMEFIQKESCGKCIPCREGTRRMLEILEAICRGRNAEGDNAALDRFKGVTLLQRLASVIKDTSLCGLGKSAPNPVLSTLRWFPEEYEEHVFMRHCRAGVCAGLRVYRIDPSLCVGCTLCARHCPTGAIVGTPKVAHTIVLDKCIGCGTCLTDCRHGAVFAS